MLWHVYGARQGSLVNYYCDIFNFGFVTDVHDHPNKNQLLKEDTALWQMDSDNVEDLAP